MACWSRLVSRLALMLCSGLPFLCCRARTAVWVEMRCRRYKTLELWRSEMRVARYTFVRFRSYTQLRSENKLPFVEFLKFSRFLVGNRLHMYGKLLNTSSVTLFSVDFRACRSHIGKPLMFIRQPFQLPFANAFRKFKAIFIANSSHTHLFCL